MEFSKTQLEAINTRNKNILVSAAAGSGKTAVLTERVAEIVRKPGGSVDRLLVVTFTRAAAAEMLVRIEGRLKELLADPNEKYKNHIKKQLRLLNKAEVTTIDSFCGRLVRKFFYKTDLDPNFMTAEESKLEDLSGEAMERVTDRAFKAYEAGEAEYACFYDLCDMFEEKGGKMTLELENEIKEIYYKISALPYPEKWLRQTKERLNCQSYEEYVNSEVIKEILRAAPSLKEAAMLETEADEILTEVLNSNFLTEEKNAVCKAADEKDLSRVYELLCSVDFKRWSVSVKKGASEQLKSDKERAKQLRDQAKSIVLEAKKICRFLTREEFENYKKSLPYVNLFYRLLTDYINEFYALKSEHNIYEFSDIERAALNMLVDENGKETETAAYVKESFDEILTDEYQDTNPLQEEILKALGKDGGRFMVGDIKQSIYGFRNADPTIFASKYLKYMGEGDDGGDRLIRLSENYRSMPEILGFVNTVFSAVMSKELGGVEYEPLNFPENSKFKGEKSNKIEVCITEKTTNNFVSFSDEETRLLEELCSNGDRSEALLIAGKIQKLVEEGFKFSDIVILFKSLSGKAEDYADVLERCGIPTVTDKPADSTNFIENLTVISLLKIIDNPLCDIDLVGVLHSPIYRLTTEELGLIKLSAKGKYYEHFYEAVSAYYNDNDNEITEKLGRFFADMEYFRIRFKTETINSVLSEIYSRTDYYNYLGLLSDSEKRQANLDKLSDLAEEYEKSGADGSLYGFLAYINSVTEGGEFKQAQVLNPENDAVRLMTIHGSKGLQFPVVFVARAQSEIINKRSGASFGNKRFGGNKKSGSGGYVKFDKELGICMRRFDGEKRVIYNSSPFFAAEQRADRETIAEGLRLYYVAMTRAEKRLIITAADSTKKKKINSYDEKLEFLKEDYDNPLGFAKTPVPPSAVYGMKSLMKLITSVLSVSESSRDYEIEFYSPYDFKGVLKSGERRVFDSRFKGGELKKADYPYEALVRLPTNVSVTEIKRMANEEAYSEKFGAKEFAFKKPSFMRKSRGGLTPTEVGTAYHTLFSALDYQNLPTDAGAFKAELVEKGILSSEEGAAIDDEKITAYLRSELAKRAANAKYVRKEHSFTMGLEASELYPEISDPALEGEVILTHGIIDLYFEEEDGIVIADFKTDRTDDVEALKAAYRPQLEVYKKALEAAGAGKVKELVLYLVRSEKTAAL